MEAARKVRQKRFVFDGEAVVLGVDGVPDFNALHSRKHDHEVQFCAFDILAESGDDLRKLALALRNRRYADQHGDDDHRHRHHGTNLDRLLARRPEGVFVNPFERGELGLISSAPHAAWALKGWSRSDEISRSAVSGWPVERLGQGEEPEAPGDEPRDVTSLMTL